MKMKKSDAIAVLEGAKSVAERDAWDSSSSLREEFIHQN